MPVVIDSAVVAVMAAVLVLLLAAARGWLGPPRPPGVPSAPRGARWAARVDTDDVGAAVVRIALTTRGGRVLQAVPVATVAPDAPEWELHVGQAMMTARVRAEVLNQEQASSLARHRRAWWSR